MYHVLKLSPRLRWRLQTAAAQRQSQRRIGAFFFLSLKMENLIIEQTCNKVIMWKKPRMGALEKAYSERFQINCDLVLFLNMRHQSFSEEQTLTNRDLYK